MESKRFLEKLERLDEAKLHNLIKSKESFVLYIRSEELYDKVKEMFDVDIVFPELAKAFQSLKFFWAELKDLKEFNNLKPPSVVIFKEGEIKETLLGVKNWAEYVSKIRESFSC